MEKNKDTTRLMRKKQSIQILLHDDHVPPLTVASQLTKELLADYSNPANSDDCSHIETFNIDDDYINEDLYKGIESDVWSYLPEDIVHKLVSYIFNRRFGWTEGSHFVNRKSLHSNLGEQEQEEQALLDQLIHWLCCQKIQKILIEGLTACIRNAKDKPVVRNQTCIHLMEWYKFQLHQYQDIKSFRENYQSVKTSVLQTLQDIWSAIRKACIARLGHIIEYFTMEQLTDFFNQLIMICTTDTSSWQSIEGSVMGLNVIVKKLRWKSADNHNEEGSCQHYSLKFGSEDLESMPDFVNKQMHQTVFNLLSHPQLTVREHAIKTFTAYISRCDLKVAISCLKDVLVGLCRGIDLEQYPLPHTAVQDPDFRFLDAYEAEGLLGVCEYLIKQIPPNQLLSIRSQYFSTFSLYLMHPASTVRQATSTVFKFIVAKDSSNPITLKFILQSLCCDWLPDMDLLLCDDQISSKPRKSVTSLRNLEVKAEDCWEWREGRLLAYELIMQFLIKNHWLYTFGASQFSDSIDSPRGQSQQRRKSLSEDKPLHASLSNPTTRKNPKDPISQLVGEETFRTRTSSLSKTIPASRDNGREKNNDQQHTGEFKPCSKPRYSIAGVSPAAELGISKSIREEHNQVFSSSVGASDICKAMNPRLTTISGYHNTSSHTVTGKHFSYYQNRNDNNQKGSTFNAAGASSLLIACQVKENRTTKRLISPRTVDRQVTEIKNPCIKPNNSRPVFTCSPTDEESNLEDLTTLFERILYQTIECIADGQWELRRMAHQLLGCIVEVIRWYDMKILEDLWDNQLKSEASLLSYGVCESLKYSVAHAAKLHRLVSSRPASWQDVKLCERIIMQIVDPIRLKVGVWSQTVYMVLQERLDYDKFTVVAMETLMLVQSHFELLTGQKYAQLNRMVSVIKELFCKAHPESELSKILSQSRLHMKHFSSPLEGFLSCCIRKEISEVGQARQVEKYLLTELEHTLPHFLKVTDANRTHILLPLLCYYLGFYVQEDKLSKQLIESVMYLCSSVMTKMKEPSTTEGEYILQSGIQATQQLHISLANTSLDEHTFKQFCDVYAAVCSFLPAEVYLPELVKTLVPRIAVNNIHPSPVQKSDRGVVVQHTPLAPIMDGPISTDEEDEEEEQIDPSLNHMSETQMLNNSVNSTGSGKGGTHHHHHKITAEEDSDWDSWDDDEGTDEDLTEATKELFQKLQKIIDGKSGEELLFRSHIDKLPTKEKHVVNSLLQM